MIKPINRGDTGAYQQCEKPFGFPDAYVSNAELYQYDLNAKVPATRDIYRRYWERCRQSDAMDFDDLLVYTYMLFRDHPEICRKYAEQFRYVLVDEYQDTNFAQHSIVLQLTQEHQRVCVVGDDAQSIYSFRGANIDNILKFTQLYKGAKLLNWSRTIVLPRPLYARQTV